MDHKKPDKADLLKELEAIHDSLINSEISAKKRILMQEFRSKEEDNDIELQIDEYGTLQNKKILEKTSDQDLASITTLPGQQSLFDESEPNHDVENTQHIENPFLPASIREKLNQHRSMLVDDLNRVGETLSKSGGDNTLPKVVIEGLPAKNDLPASSKAEIDNVKEQIVYKLVKKYLPILEAELRAELQKFVEQEFANSPNR